jgi:WS/DGAT/MGAT family acyltransferase
MQQLSGLDAEFLAMESSSVFGHVGSLIVVDPSTADGPFDLDRLTDLVAERVHLVPVLRRRLVEVPFGVDHPYWADDPAFSLEYHVRELALPAPGDDGQLTRQLARLHARPLDRSRPLWELYLVTGLSGGRAAVYSKIHHAAADGVGGDALLLAVLDPTPRARPVPPAPRWDPDPLPGGLSLLARSAAALGRRPARAARLGASLLRHAPGIAAAAVQRLPLPQPLRGPRDGVVRPGLRAPQTPFNAPITPHRRVAFADLPFDDVVEIRRRAGGTVNDVVMAICAGALRRWLVDHDALPDAPLVVAVPVSLRDDVDVVPDGHGHGNQVSAMLAALPTHLDDPRERLAAAAAAMDAAKHDHGAIPPTLLADASELTPPLIAALGWRLAARTQLASRLTPWNLFVSNVPGPTTPLYYAGARILAYFPLSAISHGQGLNVTVVSYAGRLCFGLLADRTLVPDVDRLAAHLRAELDTLLAATTPPAAAPRRTRRQPSPQPSPQPSSRRSPRPWAQPSAQNTASEASYDIQ